MDCLPLTVNTWKRGIRLLELTRNLHRLFEKRQSDEKRRLLNFVVSNLGLEGAVKSSDFAQAFDMIAVANRPRDD